MVQPNLVVRRIMVQPSIPDWDYGSSMSPAKYTQFVSWVQPGIADLVVRRIMVQPNIPNLGLISIQCIS
jgi:hypothetical protein